MRRLPQSTAYTITFMLFLASDHITAATGKTVAITISKAGGAFANPAAGATNATEISNGLYKVALGTGDTDTLGDLVIRGAIATADDAVQIAQVVSATTGGLTNLDAAISTRASQTSLDTVDDFVDTEVAAIKAKTDLIPGTVDGKTFIAGWTLMMAALLGKASGMGTATGVIRAVDDSKDRITATLDASGNRSAVTLDAS